jgi:hypothetical protein
MSRLITTKAEKATASFLDWDDASVGRMCKHMALKLKRARDAEIVKAKGENDIGAIVNAADGLLLVGSMVEMNAGKLTLEFGDFTHKGEPAGDWEIKIRQKAKPKAKSST